MRAILLSLIVFFVTAVTRPDHARCPDGFHLDGARSDGVYRCRPRSTLPDRPSRGHEPDDVDDPTLDDRELLGRIYCTGGTSPIVVDEKTVGCQRGGWRE